MIEFLGSVWWLLVTLGLLITFHEYGHFWVARRAGVRVLRFSIGFGKSLWSRTGKDGTVYTVAAFPLGGYVKMLDEREVEVPPEARDEAFNNKPLGARVAIVAAGPAFNLVFAVLAFWLMFLVGMPESRPVIGEVSGIAATAGMQTGDRIVALDNDGTETWSHAVLGLVITRVRIRRIQSRTCRHPGFHVQGPQSSCRSGRTEPGLHWFSRSIDTQYWC